MHRFYSNNLSDTEAVLDPDESRHLAKVLRLKEGDEVEVFDGSGNLFIARVNEASPKAVKLTDLKLVQKEDKRFGIHLAVAPTKNLSRWETFLEKATEIGIDRISPILCDNSERKNLKIERQLRIIKSAAKQSRKLLFPDLDEMVPFSAFIEQNKSAAKFIAHCYEDADKLPLIKAAQNVQDAIILIGPEGDFSEQEVKQAIAKGIKPVSLSKSRLRTETAAIVATHTLHLRYE